MKYDNTYDGVNVIKISVIMPVYNDEQNIEKAINSVLCQSLKEIELICIDDGSTDNSLKLLNTLAEKDDRIKVFRQENKGSGKARNKGIYEAKGEYIAFLDSDDYIVDSDSYYKLYVGAKNFDADMASGNIQFVDKGKVSFEYSCFKPITELKVTPVEDFCLPWYFYKNIFKRSLLIENDIKFPDLLRGQDPIFLAEILSKLDNYLEVPVLYYSYITPDYIKVDNPLKYRDYFYHFYLVFKLFMDDKKFKNIILRYSEILIAMKDRPIHADTVNDLFKLLSIMDKIKLLYVNYGDVNLTNRITSSFDELICKIKIPGFKLSINKNQYLDDFYSEGIIIKDKTYDPKISLDIDWGIKDKNFEDNYNEDCLKVIIEYNKYIVKLKQKIKEYEEKFGEVDDSTKFPLITNFNHILFYDKGLKNDYNGNWNSNVVNMLRKEHGTIVTPDLGNWFSPLINNVEYSLPKKFKVNIDLVEYSPQLKIILLNLDGKSIIKGLNEFEIDSSINNLSIEYDNGNIKYCAENQTMNEFCDLGDKISLHIDLWGSKKLIYREFSIQTP